MANTVEEVRRTIRMALENNGWKCPQDSLIKSFVLFRQYTHAKNLSFDISYEDICRLDSSLPHSHWLLCSNVRQDPEFLFYMVPHQVGMTLISDDPLICRPNSSRVNFKAAYTVVTIDNTTMEMMWNRRRVSVAAYRNSAELFEKFVLPHWEVFAETGLKRSFEGCIRCGTMKWPNYGGVLRHDIQCRNSRCRLMWCGDYWRDESNGGDAIRRKKMRLPCCRGYWVYSDLEDRWIEWDMQPLRS